jgi:hypothetical protein
LKAKNYPKRKEVKSMYRIVLADPDRENGWTAESEDLNEALEMAWRLNRHHEADTEVRLDGELIATVSVKIENA